MIIPKVDRIVKAPIAEYWSCKNGHKEIKNGWIEVNGAKLAVCWRCGKRARAVDETN